MAAAFASGNTGTVQAQSDSVDIFLRAKMKELHIPGMQIAIVQNGRITMSKYLGYANLQDSIAVTRNSVFAINSCTKSFTGVAMMQLVEDGKLHLSDPVSTYIDDLPPSWQPITIKQLLTHISGLPDMNWPPNPSASGNGDHANEARVWEDLKREPMDFPTGTQFLYNQTNYVLLGKIIDKLRGQPFAQVFKERQFDIANLHNTMFGDSRDVIPRFAPTYNFKTFWDGVALKEGKYVANYSEFPPFRRTASGLNSTAEDMAHWIIALQEGKLLKTKDALATMWSPATFNNGSPTQWALGWGIRKFRPRHKAVGMSGGGRAAFLVYPDDGLAVIILTNLGGSSPENFIEELAGYFNPDIAASDPLTLLRINCTKRGFENMSKVYSELKKKDPAFLPDENEMNDWGYRMMGNGELARALQVFKLNAELYPKSWNAYDSYGEALYKNGQIEEAIKAYRQSVYLNPDNAGGKKMLMQLSK